MTPLTTLRAAHSRSRTTVAVALLAFLLIGSSPTCFASTYFIRPYLNFSGGATIDGLSVDDEKFGEEFFSDASRTGSASTDLRTGEVGVFGQIVNFDNGFVISTGIMSETFTLRSGAGTDFNFNFFYDGTIEADAKSIPEDPDTYLIGVFASLAIFRPGVAEWDDWFGLATNTDEEIFFDTFSYTVTNPMEDVSDSIDQFFSFNTILASDFEQFQVFVRLETLISTSTPQSVTLDFSNTGSLGFVADPSVEVFSGSGVFPGTMPIPEPSAAILAVLGLGLLALRRRRP